MFRDKLRLMYDPSQLRTFLTVAQTLSFTQAARRLGLRQSTVSQHVRRLEDATGRQLFTRDTHSVELTEDGEAMLGFARRILDVHEQASAFFTGTRLRGRLRFGASEDFVLTRLPECWLSGGRRTRAVNSSGTTSWCGSARNGSASRRTARSR
jgi:DNA-binding transcriptional LysR family regulator